MKRTRRWNIAIFVVVGLLLSACGPTPTAEQKVLPSQLEPIEGTDFSRVVLTEQAGQRLNIQTAPVDEVQTARKLTVGGRVIATRDIPNPTSASDDTSVGTTGAKNAMMLRVPLNETELNQVDRSQPALVLLLDDEEDEDLDNETAGLMAEPDEGLADDDPEEQALYYVLDSAEYSLVPGQGVLVELSLSGSNTPRKVVPYSAVLYGVNGETWVYTSPEPLVFVRQPIAIDYIEDDLAILSEGPEAGTAVVTVGAAELFGAETGVSK